MKKKYTYLIIILLIVASCAAFGRIAGNDFINLDDDLYITENINIHSGINLKNITWTFKAVVAGNWHPLTLISHMLDWSMFGTNAGAHHIVSLLFHIGAVIFLFLFLNKSTNFLLPSAFAAAFFALHPLRVESVAWASERKDVLSMFFGMATLYAYAFYAESRKLSRYFFCLILFAMALMSKPVMVTMPFVLMLLDYWPLKRLQKALLAPAESRYKLTGRLILEKIPFVFLTIISSIVTLWAQNKGSMIAALEHLPFVVRVQNAIISSVSYLGKIFCPVDLAFSYPYEFLFPLWQILVSCFILTVITTVVIYYLKKFPFLFVGWFWYLGTLIPVIGLVQVGSQSMADRYTYLPSIGISIMLAWGIPSLIKRENIRKKILFPTGITALAILAFLTWRQCGYWKNSITLFRHSLQVTKHNAQANNNLGMALFAEGKIEEAFDNYNKAINIRPDVVAYFNRGLAYAKIGNYQNAIADFTTVIRQNSDYACYYNRGNVYAKIGQYQNAIADFNKAIRLKPDYDDAYNNRGNIYGQHGQYQLAIDDFSKVIGMNPHHIQAYNNRGLAYSALAQYQGAIKDFNKAILLKPDYANAYNNRADVYLKQGDSVSGCRDAQKACGLGNCKTLESAKGIGVCR
jgi:protein O-mannosyl-transferase